MKINSICELIKIYNGIFSYWLYNGHIELGTGSPHPTFSYFIDSYSEFGHLMDDYERNAFKCKEKLIYRYRLWKIKYKNEPLK